MKRKLFFLVWVFIFSFVSVMSAQAILWPPHRVGGTVSVTGGGTLDGCIAVLSSGGSQSVAGGAYMFNVSIYDADDNPTGTPVGTILSVSIKKGGSTLASGSFTVEAGGTTRLNFTVEIIDPNDVDNDHDGYTENEGDCDDTKANINPGATEICGDGVDQNCDGHDETCSSTPPPTHELAKLYFPISISGNGWDTEVGIMNTGNENVTGNLVAFNASGVFLDSIFLSFCPNCRQEIIVGEKFLFPSKISYLIFKSSSEQLRGYLKFYYPEDYCVAIPAQTALNEGDIPVSLILSGGEWWTAMTFLNMNEYTKSIAILFNDGQRKDIMLAPHQNKIVTIASMFDGHPQGTITSALIKNGKGIIALEFFGSHKKISGLVLKSEKQTKICYPLLKDLQKI